jgi:hypothetical protein
MSSPRSSKYDQTIGLQFRSYVNRIERIAQRFGVRSTLESGEPTSPVKRRNAHPEFIQQLSAFGLTKVSQFLSPNANGSIPMISVPNHIILKTPTHRREFENR